MATSRALDSNNDLVIENGDIKLVVDGAEVVQSVRTRLLFYLGEWFLDTSAGVPYFQEIFVKPVDLGNVESILKTTILQTDGVDTLEFFESDFDSTTRALTVNYEATTTYGEIIKEDVTING